MNRFIAHAVVAACVTIFAALSVAPARAQTVAVISLTNGPPNLSAGLLAAGMPSGSPVSDIYADMTPMSTSFTGTFTIAGGANASSFSISTATNCGTAGNITCGHLVTNGSLVAGAYNITLSTSLGGSQAVTINVVDGVHASCGTHSEFQNAVNSAGANGTVILAGTVASPCTYNFSSYITPQNGQTIIGAGQSATIINGSGNTGCTGGIRGDQNNAINVTIANTTWQSFPECPQFLDGGSVILGGDGWVVRNNHVTLNGGTGVAVLGGGNKLINNLIDHNGWGGSDGQLEPQPSSTATQVMAGNEYGFNSIALPGNQCGNQGNVKMLGVAGPGVNNQFLNNYVHDNGHFGLWYDTDIGGETHTILSNTFINNSSHGVLFENSYNADIGFNVFTGNGGGLANQSPCVPLEGVEDALAVTTGKNANVHDNNVLQNQGANWGGRGFVLEYCGGCGYVVDGTTNTNVTFQNNQMTFTTTDTSNGQSAWGMQNPQSGTISNNNTFWFPSSGDLANGTHFFWGGSIGQGGNLTYAGFQGQGQEANGSAHVGNEQATDNITGCRHVACSGAGIGTNGLPLGGAAVGQTIQNVVLSHLTFPPGVANGTVGSVTVTMNPSSLGFTGTLSVTGTNSGGFHLSGNTLQESASGTRAGTYNDFNIVATQAGIQNSPQQLSPTVTGIVAGPFGGTARSIISKIEAEDYDTGGLGNSYQAAEVCGSTGGDSYRADAVNIYTTADTGGGYKIGCNRVGDYHNYAVTISPQCGMFTLSLRVSNVETGASYHVAIDGVTVASGIAVPNTGSYDAFTTVTSGQFTLPSIGPRVLQIVLDTVGPSGFGGDLNWVQGTHL